MCFIYVSYACESLRIDLPGIIRTTTVGQSKSDIGLVDNLLKCFLEKERTIILAIVPANVDIATVDIIERAAGSDPMGERTIFCMTKVDLTAPGAEDGVADVIKYVSNATMCPCYFFSPVKTANSDSIAIPSY